MADRRRAQRNGSCFYAPLLQQLQLQGDHEPLDLLEAAAAKGFGISVCWRYHPENEIIQESGEEFQEDYEKLDFRLEVLSEAG